MNCVVELCGPGCATDLTAAHVEAPLGQRCGPRLKALSI